MSPSVSHTAQYFNRPKRAALRFLGYAALLGVAALVGYFTASALHDVEEGKFRAEYVNLADQWHKGLVFSMRQKFFTLQAMAGVAQSTCPTVESWPNCSIPHIAYCRIADPIISTQVK